MAANEYGQLETQLKRKAAVQKEAATRKLQQQFASPGRLRSGSAAKMVSQAGSEIDVGLGEQLAGLEKEKADKTHEERLIQEQQAYATRERVGTQEFQAGQSALDRSLQQKNIDLGFDSLREQQRQFDAEFGENVRTNLFNKIVGLKDLSPEQFNQAAEFLGYSASNIGNVVGKMGSIGAGTVAGKPTGTGVGGGGQKPAPKPAATGSKAAPKPAALDTSLASIKITPANIKKLKNILANGNPTKMGEQGASSPAWAAQVTKILSSGKVPATERALLTNRILSGGTYPSNSVNQIANLVKKYKL
jgi:hypothetical protein